MATLPTPEENARTVLSIYKHFGTRPGEGLLPNNFVAMAAKRGIRSEDLSAGLEYGAEQGWFTDGPNNFVMLTAAGFAEI